MSEKQAVRSREPASEPRPGRSRFRLATACFRARLGLLAPVAAPLLSRLGLLLALLTAPLLSRLGFAQEQPSSLEYPVKAAFLLNFTKFVEWPPRVFAAPSDPMTICVLGADPFGAVLNRTLEGESVNNRAIRARRLPSGSNARGCQVLFISRSEREDVRTVLTGLRGSSVLTVGEVPGFTRLGGMVEFVIEEGKVRFYINDGAAGAAGLRMSSRLLRVAKEVRNAP